GCGLRPFQSILAGQVTRYIGLDWPAEDGQAQADVLGDALRLPFGRAVVDTVLATEVMEHLPDSGAFLQEVGRVLRAGGRLILTVPFMEPIHEEPRDYFRFTPYGLRALLDRHGFDVERILPKGGFWSVVIASYVNQGLYEMINPLGKGGRRQGGPL